MRKCALLCALVLFASTFILPGRAAAQSVFVGAGVTVPTGDYSEYAKAGFLGIGGLTFPMGPQGLALLGEGYFGQNSHEFEGDKTNLYGAMGGLIYDFAAEGEAGVYLFGQAGLMVHKYSVDNSSESGSSETGLAFGAGAGYGIPLGKGSAWLEGRYMQGQFDGGSTGFFGVVAGISFRVGGGG
jgi:hypothetical protein